MYKNIQPSRRINLEALRKQPEADQVIQPISEPEPIEETAEEAIAIVDEQQRHVPGYALVIGIASVVILCGLGVFIFMHQNSPVSKQQSISVNNQSQSPEVQSVSGVTSNASQISFSIPTSVSQVSSPQNLYVKQLGLAIPLTSSISDLGYIWQVSGGYNGYPFAIIGSKSLMSSAEKDDPSDCSLGVAAKTDNLYPIGYLYGAPDNAANVNLAKSVPIGGQTFYWYQVIGNPGCYANPSKAFQDQFNSYYAKALKSFSSSEIAS